MVPDQVQLKSIKDRNNIIDKRQILLTPDNFMKSSEVIKKIKNTRLW